MKADPSFWLRLVAAPFAALSLVSPGALGAQSAGKASPRISFKVPVGGDEKKEDNKKASPFTAQEETVDGRKWGIVLANGKGVLGIPVEAGGFTPIKRAQIISERMGDLVKEGAKFKPVDGYVVGKINGEIVLAVKPGTDTQKFDLLFTVDANLDRLLNVHNKGKRISRADIAFYWRDILIKALKDQPDIAVSAEEKNAWTQIPAGYAEDKSLTPLSNSQIRRPSKGH